MEKNYECIEIYSYRDYGIAKRNLEEMQKGITSIQIDIETEDGDIDDLEAKLETLKAEYQKQQDIISKFISKQFAFDSTKLSSNLELYLKKFNMKISDLEELLQVSAGYISRTVNPESKKRLSVDIVWKICSIFEINIDDLLNRDFSLPEQTIVPVIEFLERLTMLTDKADIHWGKVNTDAEDFKELFYNELFDNENTILVYDPKCDSGTNAVGINGDVYNVNTDIGNIYIVPVFEFPGTREYFEVYVETVDEFTADHELELICATVNDKSNTLTVKCRELYNSIKTHEFDFVVSNKAKSLMSDFMKKYPDDEELPFN